MDSGFQMSFTSEWGFDSNKLWEIHSAKACEVHQQKHDKRKWPSKIGGWTNTVCFSKNWNWSQENIKHKMRNQERERDRWEVYQQQLECRNVRDRCWYPTSTRHGCVVSLRGAPYNRDVSWVAVKTAEMWHQDAPPRLAENFESPNQHCTPELLVNNSTWVARARIMSENSQGANNFFWSLGL